MINNKDFTYLVNKENPLKPNFVPDDIVTVEIEDKKIEKIVNFSSKSMISKSILPYFKQMAEDALKDGMIMIIDSGYRSYEMQQKVWDMFIEKVGLEQTKKQVALPGTSEHQTGIAMDIAFVRDNQFYDDLKEDDPESQWLMHNAYKYGFILRYPKGKEAITGYMYEPWHYRYVGVKLAKFLTLKGLTLEEYYMKKDDYDKELNIDLKKKTL